MAVETPRVEVQAPPAPASRPTIKLGKICGPQAGVADSAEFERASSGFAGCERLAKSAEARPPLSTLLQHSRCARAGSRGAIRGGQLLQPKLVSQSPPVYPAGARTQRIQGDVVMDALVDATGKVTAIKLINGHPLLQQAAMDSLRLWRYHQRV